MHLLGKVITWLIVLAALGGAFMGAYLVNDRVRLRKAAEAEQNKLDVPKRANNGIVKLGAKLAESHGIKDGPAQAISWQPRLTVYGRVVPNPQATIEVRAPFAGTLRTNDHMPWPWPGQWVKAGQMLGRMDIRIGPQERLDFQAKLNEARLKLRGAEEVLKVQEERVDRLQKLGTGEIVSRKELDEAKVQLIEARTTRMIAEGAVETWQGALNMIDQAREKPISTWSLPLTAPTDGEVTELVARPGMMLESGGLIARVVDFRRPLVRLDLPPDALRAHPPETVDLLAASMAAPTLASKAKLSEPLPVRAYLIGSAPQVDAASQYASYLYEVRPSSPPGESISNGQLGGASWRPGLFVKAQITVASSKSQDAIAVPRPAVLFHQGRALVYVRIGPGRYERREVHLLGDNGFNLVLADGVNAGEPVVFLQAQVLLSEEFRGDVDND